MSINTREIVRSYRSIYREALHATQYSAPARGTLRRVLNNAYRLNKASDYDPYRVKNTVAFLRCATQEKGLEHRMLKSLLHTWHWKGRLRLIVTG